MYLGINTKALFIAIYILALPSVFATESITPQDSIKKILPTLKGEARLQAYSNLCGIAFAQDDSLNELSCLDEYIAEAHRQGNIKEEAFARQSKMVCYYNYDMNDALIAALPTNLSFFESNQQWELYYNSWSLLVDLHIYQNQYQTALQEAKRIYADARKRNNSYGLGVASYCIGDVYHHMQNTEEASIAYAQAIELLSDMDDQTLLMGTYENYSEVLSGAAEYVKLKSVTAAWKEKLDLLKIRYKTKGYEVSDLDSKYRYCYLAMAEAEMETGGMEQSLQLLRMAEKLTEGNAPIAHLLLLRSYARYYQLQKEYDTALAYNSKRLELNKLGNNNRGLLDTKEQRADILLSAKRYADAALLYHEIMPTRDSLASASTAEQLNELRTIYEVDKLKLEKKVSKTQLAIVLTISAFLLLILLGYIAYSVRLKRKNRILYEKIRRIQEAESQAEQALRSTPENTLSKEQALFRSLNSILSEKQLFTNPKIGRKELSDSLGTNATYLAEAIKECANGMTVTEYLNRVRLVHAGNMLIEEPLLPVDAVGEDCGFTSRSTYYRLFRDYYGMSPTEFRNIAKEKSKRAEV
ncbi:MAG: AraC family transcriptional regulator [Bacteroidales bacterium]|nr:AraC family transcriptional regulator [Bacteroidales bacterium]MBN2748857.1 AraC family transcriptional regulator [Bacteroidales bacterium]